MAGWEIKSGLITENNPSEERIWSLFNFVFSDACKKRNTYKFGLIKALLDNLFNGKRTDYGVIFYFDDLFGRFTENYWNLVVKYDIRQMRKDGKAVLSKVEYILKSLIDAEPTLQILEFEAITDEKKRNIVDNVIVECKKYVIGALYNDFDGIIYSFDLNDKSLTLNYVIYEFMLKHKAELEKLNYYSWAKFLEHINDDNVLIHLLEKLELSTPKRENLSIYRKILFKELEECTCFYCGKNLEKKIHVDHFIPWSYIKDNKMWNFVLSCPSCNEKKNNKIPNQKFLLKLENRNRSLQFIDNKVIKDDFIGYTDGLLRKIWHYAKNSGFKEYVI